MSERNKKEIAAQVSKLAQQLLSDSQGSIDYADNAKAIAFMNEDVRNKVTDVIAEGFTLTEVRPLLGFGSSLMNFKVVIEFAKDEKDVVVRTPKRFMTITVQIPNRAVSAVEHGTPKTAGGGVFAAPFSIVNPNPAVAHRTPIAEVYARRAAERQYFSDAGLPGYGTGRPGVGNPGDPFGPLPGRRPGVINPGGPFGGFGPAWGNQTVATVQATGSDTSVDTWTGTETESDGIADDSANDGADYDGSRNDDVVNDGETPDPGDTGYMRRTFF